MIRILLTVLGVSLCISEPSFAQDRVQESAPWNNSADASVGPVVAFIGEKIFVKESDLDQTDNVIHGTSSAPDAGLKVRVHAACVSRLEAEDNL